MRNKTTIWLDARSMIRLDHRRDIDLENLLYQCHQSHGIETQLVAAPEYVNWANHALREAGVWDGMFPIQSLPNVLPE
jgi:hypothetical protein